jgi:hypothetical protein
MAADRHQVFQQPGQAVGPAGQARINPGTGHSSPVLRRNRAGAAARFAGDEAFGGQALQRPPDRDPGHGKLLHQRKFTGHPVDETPLFELLAQHQINLVVLGQGQDRRHAHHRPTVLLSCQ